MKQFLILSFSLGVLLVSCKDDDNGPEDQGFQGEVAWTKSFGGSLNDIPTKIITTSDNGYAILGTLASNDQDVTFHQRANDDFWLMKFDANDNLEWQKAYGGSSPDIGADLVQTQDGGYLLAGYSQSNDGDATVNEGFFDNWLVKVNSTGQLQWQKSFGFAGQDRAYSVVECDGDGYAIAGFLDVTLSNGQGATDRVNGANAFFHGVGEFWIHRLNEDGSIRWRKYFGGTNNDRAFSIVKTPNQGFMVFGFTESDDFDVVDTNGGYEFWAVKLDKDGRKEWTKTYGGSLTDRAISALRTEQGNYLIAGSTQSSNGDVTNFKGTTDLWIIEISPTGELLKEKTFGGTEFDIPSSIKASKDGNYWVIGHSRSDNGDLTKNNGQNDAWVLKISPELELLWQDSFGGSTFDFGTDIAEVKENEVVLLIDSRSSFNTITNKGRKDAVLIKLK